MKRMWIGALVALVLGMGTMVWADEQPSTALSGKGAMEFVKDILAFPGVNVDAIIALDSLEKNFGIGATTNLLTFAKTINLTVGYTAHQDTMFGGKTWEKPIIGFSTDLQDLAKKLDFDLKLPLLDGKKVGLSFAKDWRSDSAWSVQLTTTIIGLK